MENLNAFKLNKTRPDCKSDHEPPYSKIQTKIENSRKKKKSTKPFRYELNQIPYDYTVKASNRFKGLDLIECLKKCGWSFITLNRRQCPKP